MQNQNLKSQFLSTLFDRGFIHDCTDLHGLDLVLINNEETTNIKIKLPATIPSIPSIKFIKLIIAVPINKKIM